MHEPHACGATGMEGRETVVAALQSRGLKVTQPRLTLLELMAELRQPLDAESIYRLLGKDGRGPNLSTVYRMLEQLGAAGLLRRTLSAAGEGRALYEREDGSHTHHFRCTVCRMVIPVPGCPVRELEMQLSESLRVRVDGHRLELFGLCPSCLFDSQNAK